MGDPDDMTEEERAKRKILGAWIHDRSSLVDKVVWVVIILMLAAPVLMKECDHLLMGTQR